MKFGLTILLTSLCFSAFAQDVPASIYDFKVKANNGGTIDFAQYKGKKILVINTPSLSDNNPRYAELEAMYRQYRDKVEVIAFLDEDFGTQPGSRKTADTRPRHYDVSFPLAAKVMVRGKDMAPVYKWLTQKKYNHLKDSEVKWDFQKYLIDENGALIAVFDPKVKPAGTEITSAIAK